MTRKPSSELPFRIDHVSRVGVSDQLYDALRAAMDSGVYRAGDVLPTMRDISRGTGVSFCTVRRVLANLTRDGYVNPRPRVGSVVVPRRSTMWRGNVLFVYPDDDESSFYMHMFSGTLRRKFISAGYLFTVVPASRKLNGSRAQLAAVLGRTFDVAVVMYDSPHAVKMLKDAGVRVVWVFGPGDGCADAVIGVRNDTPLRAFVDHCVKTGIKSVVEVDYDTPDMPTVARQLHAVGIGTDRIRVRAPRSGGLDELKQASIDRFLELDRAAFPDLFLFWDDFVAQGALMALLSRGIRIPDDVKVVTLFNRGIGPVFTVPLTRFEYDAQSDGAIVADYVIASLVPRRRPRVPELRRSYVIGETFPGV